MHVSDTMWRWWCYDKYPWGRNEREDKISSHWTSYWKHMSERERTDDKGKTRSR